MNGATDLALEDDSPVSRRRPGGRTERVRREVAEAVLDLFRAGRSDFSVAEVADRAGVHRSTVYRRWPTPADLVREALTLHTQDLHVPDTGSWEGDVAALARRLAKFFANPVEVSMNAALASGTSPEIDAVMIDHWKPLFSEMAAIVARASERGEVGSDTDPILVMYLLVGPLLMETAFLRRTPSRRFVEQIAKGVAAAMKTTKPPRRRPHAQVRDGRGKSFP